MDYGNIIHRDKKGRRVIRVNSDSSGAFVLMDSGKHKLVFKSGDELIPKVEGGWKIVDQHKEVDLPNDCKWKIIFFDSSELLPLPYKTITSGEWVILRASGFLKGEIMVYRYGGLFEPGGFFDVEKKLHKARKKQLKIMNQISKSRRRRDDDNDDEDDIMRALDSGNGDLLGF